MEQNKKSIKVSNIMKKKEDIVNIDQKQDANSKKNSTDWFRIWECIDKIINKFSRAMIIAVIIRLLFELAPALKEKLPTIYSWYEWGAQLLETLFKFTFNLIGAIFKGKEFPSLDAFREILTAFVQLF